MEYDHGTPIAVFLGPSLDVETARTILPANYYPPVQLGDVYRLLATGVELIVVIDGVFYASTPVWQRELLAALDFGITVIGASSMGALRAVELSPYGMIGIGKVYEWYAEGKIYGDDEVALLHASGDYGSRKLSEPLVNMRYNIERACSQGVIDEHQGKDILDSMTEMYFGRRTYDLLFESPPFIKLPSSEQTRLKKFMSDKREDVKRLDAVEALQYCAGPCRERERSSSRKAVHRTSESLIFEVLLRGALSSSGELVPLSKVLERAKEHEDIRPHEPAIVIEGIYY